MTKKISQAKANKALAIVATWLGPQMGHEGPAPTGQDAAYHALGPQLVMDWDWPSAGPTPTILLEGGPEEWAISASMNEQIRRDLAKIGVWSEPYASYALCLYPD
jgi:hypothetical protein